MSSIAIRRSRVGQSTRPLVMIMTNSAPIRNSPDTRSVQASAVSAAAASQRSDRARSQAQKAAAQNSDSVYGTVVKTAVGANSHAMAAHCPPSRASATAAQAEPIADRMMPVTATGRPSASPAESRLGRPGKNAIRFGADR
jgi:hypothetical protein